MGGGQAGAPADDDHVPWSRPPRRGHRAAVTAGGSRRGPARPGRPVYRGRSGPRPGSGPIGRGRGRSEAVGDRVGAAKEEPSSTEIPHSRNFCRLGYGPT